MASGVVCAGRRLMGTSVGADKQNKPYRGKSETFFEALAKERRRPTTFTYAEVKKMREFSEPRGVELDVSDYQSALLVRAKAVWEDVNMLRDDPNAISPSQMREKAEADIYDIEVWIESDELWKVPGRFGLVRESDLIERLSKTSITVTLRHKPTGTFVECKNYKDQDENRLFARRLMGKRLKELVIAQSPNKNKNTARNKRRNRSNNQFGPA
ncbi:hypothetical protein AAMO2058_000832500 [Amorphochlora amoebiformis]